MLTPIETLLLLNESIFKFENTNSTILIDNFFLHYPFLTPFLLEYGLYDTDFARSINSKIFLMQEFLINNPTNNLICGSNIIPENKKYDFYMFSETWYNIHNYQLKLRLTDNTTYSVNDLYYYVDNYNINIKNNNYLVLDNSLQNDYLKNKLYNIINSDNLLNKLYNNNKLVLQKKNLLNLSNLEFLNNVIKYKKLLLLK